jgi:hypothetical protein
MTTELISPDLKTILRRLRLSRILDTLPERLVLARQQKMPHQDWLLLILSDEATRRDSLAVTLRVQKRDVSRTRVLGFCRSCSSTTSNRARSTAGTPLRVMVGGARAGSGRLGGGRQPAVPLADRYAQVGLCVGLRGIPTNSGSRGR